MIKVQAISDFNFSSMDKISNLKRAKIEKENYIFKDDIFECDKKMYKYLTGENALKKVVVRILEVIPQKEEPKVIEEFQEEPIKKSKKKRTSKK